MDVTYLNTLIIRSLKSGNKLRTETLRSLLSDVRYFGIEKYKSGWEKMLSPSDIEEVVKKQVKKHKESIEIFTKAGRDELVQKETSELQILMEFMPQDVDDSVILSAIDEAVNSGEKDFGKLMKAVMGKLKGQASGQRVMELLKPRI